MSSNFIKNDISPQFDIFWQLVLDNLVFLDFLDFPKIEIFDLFYAHSGKSINSFQSK